MVAGVRFATVGASLKNVLATYSGGPRPTAGYGLIDLFASYVYNDRMGANFTVKDGIMIKLAER